MLQWRPLLLPQAGCGGIVARTNAGRWLQVITKLRMINGLVLASLLLGACASSGVAPDAGGSAAAASSGEETPAISPAAQQRNRLTNEAIYDVLVGEIAGQRGQLPLSVSHYLHAARLTRDPHVAERATRMTLFVGDIKTGLEAARLWVELQPDSNEAHQILSVLLLRNGEMAAAQAELETLLVMLRPRGAEEAYGLVAVLLAREKNRDAALSIMSQLVDRADRYRPEALFALGHLNLQADRPTLALDALDKALRTRPGWNNAIILRARVLQVQGKGEAALNYLAGTVKAQPRDTSLRLAYGRALIDVKQFDQARAQFIVLAQQDPSNSDVLFALGILYLQANQDSQAKQQFLRLVKLGQRVRESSFYLGQIAEVQNQPEEALTWYRAVKEGENALDAQIRIAALLARHGNLAAAREHLQSLEPKDTAQAVRLVLVESELLREGGRLEEAMDILSRAIEELPGNADLLYARAMTAERLNKLSILEQDLITILTADPDHIQALNALGYTLADRTDRFQDALGYIQRALALRPNDFYILDSMGWLQYRLGHHAEAVRYLQQALAIKTDSEVAAHLGEVLWVMGNHRDARKVWLQALKNDPAAKVVREAMDRFNER
ncbi:putative TPR repeat-containing protein PA4667 [Gammaproteobacteria bacterium]